MAWDAQRLPLAWYGEFLGTPLTLNRARRLKQEALAEFEDYREQFKTWSEWADLVARCSDGTGEAVA